MKEPIVGEARRRGRRQVLLGGAAGAVSLLSFKPASAAAFDQGWDALSGERPPLAATSELFAYPTRAGRSTVIAVTWLESSFVDGSASTSEIAIHSGKHRWTGVVGANPRVLDAPKIEHRAFIGDIAQGRAAAGGRHMAFFVEAPTDALAGGEVLQIWAERKRLDGSRRRIGSPFMALLIDEHPELSKAYHTSDPKADRESLLRELQEVLAAKSRLGADDPRGSRLANRLANELVPDVLHYDPSEPCGFTFAARNGRFPSDRCDAIVRSVLARSVSS